MLHQAPRHESLATSSSAHRAVVNWRVAPRFGAGRLIVCSVVLALLSSGGSIETDARFEGSAESIGTEARAVKDGRTFTRWFEDGAIDRLWPRLSRELQNALGGRSGFGAFRQKLHESAGREISVVEERTVRWLRAVIYNRAVHRANVSELWWTQWTIADNRATRFLVRPAPAAAATAFFEYETKTPLRLPFRRSWFVFWGGRTVLENYHASSATQRFAYDFLVAGSGRTSRIAVPRANGDYFCFDRPVLAPATGTVRAAVGNVPDNVPGRMNEDQPLGNHVVLDHANGEYSFLAHLKQGSLRVRPGQRVRSGEWLARCGNSGRSSEPHLHYHLQTMPDAELGKGLPAQFLTYWADGRSVERGEPRRGQFVAPGAAEAFEAGVDLHLFRRWASFVQSVIGEQVVLGHQAHHAGERSPSLRRSEVGCRRRAGRGRLRVRVAARAARGGTPPIRLTCK